MVYKIAQRVITQRLVAGTKPLIQKYITKHYGEIAGSLAGIGLSVFAGDYYGAITGATGSGGNGSPGDRTPPFGYYQGNGGITGKTYYTQYQAHRSIQHKNNRGRNRRKSNNSGCCCCRQ